MFLGVWWAWNYTAWATNWINPDHSAVRGMMMTLMLLSLLMAAAIPEAYSGKGLEFAVPYVCLQVARSAFMVFALRNDDKMGRNYAQLLAWSAIAGVF